MKLNTLLITALSAVVVLSACESKQTKQAKGVETVLNSAGDGTWTRVKDTSRIKGYAVYLGPDGAYHAIDVSKYTPGMTMQQLMQANQVYDGLQKSIYTYQSWDEVASYSYYRDYCPHDSSSTSYNCSAETDAYGKFLDYRVQESDYGWVTHHEDIYTDPKNGLVFDIGASGNKDLEAVAAQVTSTSVAQVRAQFVASYGLSQERANQLASLAVSYQNIAKTRALTAKDLSDAQIAALGSNLSAVASAKKKAASGDSKDYNAILQKAAQMNDISPEQAKSIMNSFM